MPRAKLLLPIVVLLAAAAGITVLFRFGSSDSAAIDGGEESARSARANRPERPGAIDASGAPAALAGNAPVERAVEEGGPRSGPPAFTIKGRVLAADGSPLAGVRVRLLERAPAFVLKGISTDLGGKQSTAAEALALSDASAASGEYTLGIATGAKTGGYLSPSDPFLAARDPVFVDATAEGAAPDLVVVGAGVVTGRVLDSDGKAVADARVRIEDDFNPMEWMSNPNRLHPGATRTDADGRFRIESFPAGVSGFVSAEVDGTLPAREPVKLAAGATANVDLHLASGTSISGTVLKPDGAPAGGAKITARQAAVKFNNADTRTFDVEKVVATAGADGSFRVSGLTPGTYNLDARKDGFAPGKRGKVKVDEGGLTLPEPLRLEAGESISGVVLDDTGAAVAHARVSFQRPLPFMPGASAQSAEMAEQMGGSTTETNDEGRFTSPALKPGAYDVTADKEGLCAAAKKSVKTGAIDVRLELARRGNIEGIVVSREDGEPVHRFTAVASKPFDLSSMMDAENFIPGAPKTFVTKDGRFQLTGLKPGEFTLEIAAERFARASVKSIAVKSGETTKGVIVLLLPESCVRGSVIDDATGAPVPDARITTLSGMARLRPDPIERGTTARSNASGAFELLGLKAGRYELSADAKGYATGTTAAVSLAEGQSQVGIVVRLKRGAVIEGAVKSKDREPQRGALVVATRIGDVMPKMANTGADGTYRIEGLVAGSYSVSRMNQFELDEDNFLGSMFNGLSTQTVKLKDGEVRRVDFDATAATGTVVEGTVKDGRDPLAGAIVVFTPEGSKAGALDTALPGEQFRMATADPDGHYRVENVAPGEWTATVQSGSDLSNIQRESFDVTVPAQATYHHDFELHSTGFEGTITSRRDGKPIAGARVSVDAVDKDAVVDAFYRASGSTRMAEVMADAAGKYRVRGLKPGRYAVRAGGPSLLGLGSSGFARSKPVAADVNEGSSTSGVDFQLDPGGTVVGTVTAKGGGPIAGATMFFLPLAGREKIPFGETFSTTGGSYRCDGLTEGQYTVVAKASGFAPAYRAGAFLLRCG